AVGGCPGSVHAEAVPLSGPDAGHVHVMDERALLAHLDAGLVPAVVEQRELDLVGDLREEREVRADAVPRRPEGERMTGPDGEVVDVRRRVLRARDARNARGVRPSRPRHGPLVRLWHGHPRIWSRTNADVNATGTRTLHRSAPKLAAPRCLRIVLAAALTA